MDQPNPTFAKIPILDIEKFEQWKFRIQQYLQNEHYALWEVIEFCDSYQAPPEESDTCSASESSTKKKGRTVAITTEDIDDLDTMSLYDVYNHLKVYEPEVQKKSKSNSQNMAFISSADTSSGKGENNTASIRTASTQVSTASADVAAASISHDATGKKITIQSTDVAGFDKSKVECFNCHKMGHFARECRVPRSQDRGRRESYKQGSKEEELAPKTLMAIDGIGWDWSYMANEEENHALVADEEAPTEFALMAKSSSSSKNEVFDDSFGSKSCRKNTDSLNTNITKLNEALSDNFKVKDDTNVLLRTPRQHNMYSIDLNNGVPHKNLSCLVAKASDDESMLWHRRLGHLNFKTMNKKQHKASCKTKLVNSVSKPLHTLHMDLFGPTSVSSRNHKWYCLVVTDDFSRFTWTFFLRTKDETSGILRNFITEIENLKDLKVKIITCDNGGVFKNKEMNELCTKKGIKRKFSNARTPHQNRVAEIRNRNLIKAARTMLADAKLLVTFWAEAVNTTCYVQNGVLVNKSQNKTPYELFNSRTPAIGFLRPFGCHVMILNTVDHLGKFDAKGDEGYFVRYSMSSKAFRVFNKRTKKVEENLHVDFFENKLIEKGAGPNWLFDIDTLTNSMNYVPVVVVGTSSTNISGTKDDASQGVKKDVSSLRYIAFLNWFHEAHMESFNSDACNADVFESSGISNPTATLKILAPEQMELLTVKSGFPTVSLPVPIVFLDTSPETSSGSRLISKEEEPKKIGDALKDPIWVETMQEELLQFKIQNVWILVNCPKGIRPIGIKWVLKNKKDERGL
nr:hypothetical protein [Tanacetum cinerariifolium]